jgi:hypothetical protein
LSDFRHTSFLPRILLTCMIVHERQMHGTWSAHG